MNGAMTKKQIGFYGLIIGIVCLLTTVLHAWFGPIEPETLTRLAVRKAHEFEHSAVASLTHNKVSMHRETHFGPDWLLKTATLLAALAGFVGGLAGVVRRENPRICVSAMAMCAVTVIVQFF